MITRKCAVCLKPVGMNNDHTKCKKHYKRFPEKRRKKRVSDKQAGKLTKHIHKISN